MSANFSRLVSSEVLKLVPLVDHDKEERFLVHAALLASQSGYLRNLIEKTSGGSSGPERELDIGSWESETLGRLVEFVYTRDYHCPDPAPLDTPTTTPEGGSVSGSVGEENVTAAAAPPSTESEQDNEAGELRWQFWLPQPQAQQLQGLAPLSEMFAPEILNPQRKPSAAETFATKDFHPAEHDFEEVFLAHAKVYAIARAFEIEALCVLALQRLLRTLVNIGPVPPGSALVSNFVELARYAYAYATLLGTQDPLRDLVSQFAALNFTSMQTQEMKKLMKGGGDFASDLMEKISVTLVAGGRLSSLQDEEVTKEMGELRREVLEARTKAREDLKIIERLGGEVLEARMKAREDLDMIEGLKRDVLGGSIKSQQDKTDFERLVKEFHVESMRAQRELKAKVEGFERVLLEGNKSKKIELQELKRYLGI